MAAKPVRRKRGSRSDDADEAEQTRPRGPAAVGVMRHHGTRRHRRQRSS